jgi:hypothetical protein
MVWDPNSFKRMARFAQMDPEPQDGAMMNVSVLSWSEIDYEVSMIEVQVSADITMMPPQDAMAHIDRAVGNETETGPLTNPQFKQVGDTWVLYGTFGRDKFAAEYVNLNNGFDEAAALAEQECEKHAETGAL